MSATQSPADSMSVKGVADEATELLSNAREAAEKNAIKEFRAFGSDIIHEHSPVKHSAVEEYDLNPEFVAENFKFLPFDHAALHEMHHRRSEFHTAEFTERDTAAVIEAATTMRSNAHVPQYVTAELSDAN